MPLRLSESRGPALTLTDSSDQPRPTEASRGPIEDQPTTSLPSDGTPEVAAAEQPSAESSAAADQGRSHRRILIGSQRDPAAYRARQKRDWTPVDETAEKPKRKRGGERGEGRGARGEGRGRGERRKRGRGKDATTGHPRQNTNGIKISGPPPRSLVPRPSPLAPRPPPLAPRPSPLAPRR